MLRVIIYMIIFAVWAYAFYYDVMFVPSRRSGLTWWSKLRFLTILNMVIETFYFGLCVVRACNDQWHEPNRKVKQLKEVVPSYYYNSKLHRICDRLYCSVCFPGGTFVVLMFWTLYSIDRELVYPKELDLIIPTWLNHVLHTYPVPFLLIDTLLVCHKYPDRRTGLTITLALNLVYATSIFVWFFCTGTWAYPIFEVLSWSQRFLFCGVGSLCFVGLYLLGEGINRLVWGEACHPTEEEQLKIDHEITNPSLRRSNRKPKQRTE